MWPDGRPGQATNVASFVRLVNNTPSKAASLLRCGDHNRHSVEIEIAFCYMTNIISRDRINAASINFVPANPQTVQFVQADQKTE